MKNFIYSLCLLLLVVAAPVAKAGEALVTSEVQVDVTGKDAADARAQALAKGEIDALMELLSRLTTQEQVKAIIAGLDAPKISAMVRSTEVLEERIAGKRYHARLLVAFDGDQLSALVGNGKTTAAVDKNAPAVGAFLIIPAYTENDTSQLWEDGNPWRMVWKSVGLEVNSGDIVVPFGDNQDQAMLSAKTVASANYASLAPFLVRYGVSDIVILQATFSATPDMTLSVVKRHISRTDNDVTLLNYRADPQETRDVLLARAAHDIVDNVQRKKIEAIEISKTVVQGGERHEVMALAGITTLASWTQLKAKLVAMPMIDRLEVLAIAPRQVDMIIHYRGTPDALAAAIQAQQIRLVKNANYWVLSRD